MPIYLYLLSYGLYLGLIFYAWRSSQIFHPVCVILISLLLCFGQNQSPILLLENFSLLLSLLFLLRSTKQKDLALMIFAWNPLFLWFGLEEQVLFFCICLSLGLAFSQRKERYSSALGCFCLGLASFFNIYILLFFPFICFRHNWFSMLFLPLGYGVLFFSPYFSLWPSPESTLPGLFFYLIQLVDVGGLWQLALGVFFLGGLARIWLLNPNSPHDLFRVWGWLLLFLPSVSFSYYCSLLIFLVLCPNFTWLLFGMTLPLSYFLVNLGYEFSLGTIVAITYAPIVTAFFYELWEKRFPWYPSHRPIESLDIVIPTLNEEKYISLCLDSVSKAIEKAKKEFSIPINVYICDGGSVDQTHSIAQKYPFHWQVASLRGRGNQIAAGFHSGKGDLVLMLHADAEIREDALGHLLQKFKKTPTLVWGVLGYYFPLDSRFDKQFYYFERFRLLFWGMSYGDQGIFLRREAIEKKGSIPEIPLLEDMEICLRLAGQPRVYQGNYICGSERRWLNKSFFFEIRYLAFATWLGRQYLFWRRISLAKGEKSSFSIYKKYYEHPTFVPDMSEVVSSPKK